MKNVILSIAAMFCGAMMFGQTPLPTQVTPNPLAPAGANAADANQTGHGQLLKIKQIGYFNSAKTTQGDGTGHGMNEAEIDQNSGSTGAGNAGEVRQLGTENEGAIQQKSFDNNARVDQGQTDDSSSDNKARIEQGDVHGPNETLGTGNIGYIAQDGDDNSAKTIQTNDNNDAWTDQDGNHNQAQIRQTSTDAPMSSGGADEGQTAKVVQHGNTNASWVDQDGRGAGNEAYTTQVGDNNIAVQKQFSTVDWANHGNTAIIEQGPTGHVSNNAYASQDQEGINQEATIKQYNGDSDSQNRARQFQRGNANEADITQTMDNSGHGKNYANQEQNGILNDADLVQNGKNNKAYQLQDGDRNTVDSDQDGNGNKLNTYQFGNNNYALTQQNHDNNAALVVQYDGQSAVVSQSGFENSANIFQAGPNGGGHEVLFCVFPDFGGHPDYQDPVLDVQPVCQDCD
ncbi:hypothetical protein [Gillisia hiemivivida]|uniref:Curlin n=1 Tax=Gillisia hiemivivida TaxID=291190 RepID=A0A5C6ZRH3_9FLAO|nr:hypothetical protein [Gillisia hiemivivida]TXD92527.1 hypothetical protein ES724_13645 [Gillisia hiemivivida]